MLLCLLIGMVLNAFSWLLIYLALKLTSNTIFFAVDVLEPWGLTFILIGDAHSLDSPR